MHQLPLAAAVARLPLLATLSLLAPLAAQSFTVVGLPDTQNYSQSFPQIFYQQTQWVVDNAARLDIRFVSHYGDLVNNGDRPNEWAVADRAMATLDAAGIPYGVLPGNHDVLPSGSSGQPYIPEFYRQYFPASRYAGREWFRGVSPSGMSNWQLFEGGGLAFVVLHVEVDAAVRELEWAQAVLDANRDKPALLVTHRYLQDAQDYTGGFPVVPSGRYPRIWYSVEGLYVPGGTQSEDIFGWFVRRNPNILMVQCGHFHEEFRQTSTNVRGKPVHEVLADYQDDPNGGDGWLRVMRFDIGANRVDVESYSPFLDRFRSADESRFSLPVRFADYYETLPTVVLQQGIGGYAGSVDTWIDEARPDRAFGADALLRVDDDTTNSLFSDRRGQALLRFDGLVGAPGAGAIPPGARIVRAHLSVDFADDIDSPVFDADIFLHRCLVPWSATSTWNSLGGGLQANELSPRIAVLEGDNQPNDDGLRYVDVTDAIQAWVDGAPNHGFALLPEIVPGNDDGVEIFASESGNGLLRPRLEVVFESDCGYRGYGSSAGPANFMNLAGLGLPRLGGALDLVTTLAPNPNVVTLLATGAGSQPFLDGVLLVDVASIVGASPGDSRRFTLPIPVQPNLVDARFFLQSFALDPSRPAGLAMSNGVEATICR